MSLLTASNYLLLFFIVIWKWDWYLENGSKVSIIWKYLKTNQPIQYFQWNGSKSIFKLFEMRKTNILTIWEFSNSNQTNRSLQWKGREKYFLKKSFRLRQIWKWDEKLNSNENSNQTNQSLQWNGNEKYFLKGISGLRLV